MQSGMANYLELAALIIPEHRTVSVLKQKLRAACPFLPMPLTIGWERDPLEETVASNLLEGTVPGLLLSDPKSGATRSVQTLWMHALYEHSHQLQPRGAVQVGLKELSFSQHVSWPHLIVIATFLSQCLLALHSIIRNEHREGLMILSGLFLRILEATFAHVYPKFRPPRTLYKLREKKPLYVLHTGMTTTHLILLSHDSKKRYSDQQLEFISLEDAAFPQQHLRRGWQRRFEVMFRALLVAMRAIWKGAVVLIPSTSFMIPVVLALGGATLEIMGVLVKAIPACTYRLPLPQYPKDILDAINAIAQETNHISTGFVESLLPDPEGNRETCRVSLA